MKLKYIFPMVLIALMASCTDKFEDYNTDIKRPQEVPGSTLFTSGQKALADQIATPNVNLNVWRLFAQYWTETTYTDEANYDIVNRTIPDNTFQEYYRDVLRDFNEAYKLFITEEVSDFNTTADKCNKRQICELMTAYAYVDLAVIFGDVPYSETMDIEDLHPAYDNDSLIFLNLLSKIDAALDSFEITGNPGLGTADIIYQGDIAQWIKFANSLKIKIGIILADIMPAVSEAAIEEAYTGAIASNQDNALFYYQGASPNANEIYEELVLTGRHDFVAANTIVNIMNALDDPRRAEFFTMADTSTDPAVVKPAYIGGEYGYSSPYSQYSHVSDRIQEPLFDGFFITFDEISFYLAEAAARGFSVGGTAEDFYTQGITASFDYWGVDSVDVYLANPAVAYNDANWRESIGVQSWIALYTRGLEGYTQWRRLDYPLFNIPEAWGAYSDIPLRFTYPVIEQTINEDNYYMAADAIGGDELSTPLFWDTDQPNW